MSGELFIVAASSLHAAYVISILLEQGIPILLEQTYRRFPKKRAKSQRIGVVEEDRIGALPDDLLVKILSLVPTKDAVATMVLSKRWRSVWTMVPKLDYLETNNDGVKKLVIGGLLGRLLRRLFGKSDEQERRQWRFIDESLKVHKAPVLEQLAIELGPGCDPVDVDVGKWIDKAVDTRVRLGLSSVVYKDDDSLARLLSSCPVLKHLAVERHDQDKVKIFNIQAPLLECLFYNYVELGAQYYGQDMDAGNLVINSPALKKIFIADHSRDSCSIENEPRLNKAMINLFSYPDVKFMTSLSSVMYLELVLSFQTLAWFNTINFSQLMDCKIILGQELDWLEPLMFLLQNSPNLKVLFIDKTFMEPAEEEESLSWNQPVSVPGCLSTHLEIFEWKGYGGRNQEREFVRYIFANSKCLQRAGFSLKRNKMMKELESMSRVSTSSQLLFSTQLEYFSLPDEMRL
ncbi:unnamed protein product [Thlaspi arvense]|uniref:F-box domain-containing protein n=1 Tax=Thlaspi arvense TaxID=13288 RepID=A0AAU9SFW4_THLAR|nr:unnamed protein product [Thlaspi arvense]